MISLSTLMNDKHCSKRFSNGVQLFYSNCLKDRQNCIMWQWFKNCLHENPELFNGFIQYESAYYFLSQWRHGSVVSSLEKKIIKKDRFLIRWSKRFVRFRGRAISFSLWDSKKHFPINPRQLQFKMKVFFSHRCSKDGW